MAKPSALLSPILVDRPLFNPICSCKPEIAPVIPTTLAVELLFGQCRTSRCRFSTRRQTNRWGPEGQASRCPPLAKPGAIVEALYVEGNRIDSARYEVLKEQALIRWTPADQPQRVAATIRLTEDLTLGAETDRWKKLAIILPVVATIVSAAIAGGTTYLSKAVPEGRSSGRPATTSSTVQVPSATAPQDSTSAEDTDNTRISKARTLAFGRPNCDPQAVHDRRPVLGSRRRPRRC